MVMLVVCTNAISTQNTPIYMQLPTSRYKASNPI